MKRYLPFVIIAVVLLVALGVGRALYRSAQTETGAPAVASNNVNAATTFPLTTTTPKPDLAAAAPGADPPRAHGPATAKVMLEEFGDFQCPPCRVFHGELKTIESEFGDRVRVVFRHFPLRMHKHAMTAARAAEAAGMQNRYWEMHNRLYEDQSKWKDAPDARPLFIEYARFLNLDVERFRRDLESEATNQRVTLDMRRGESMGVTGTPTVFLNNREVPYAQTSASALRGLINLALKR